MHTADQYAGLVAHDRFGNMVVNDPHHFPGGQGDLFYSPLALHDPSALDTNDLGGAGTGLVRFRDVSTTRSGQRVSLEVFNTTEYRPANRERNGYLNRFFQVNLAPLFDPLGSGEQPFVQLAQQVANFNLGVPGVTLNAELCNMVGLWYRFVDQATGTDVELEEFSVSLFDFDQDFADGDRAYVRETVIVADWTTVFLSNTSTLETFFAEVPERPVTSIDASTRKPNAWGLVMKRGVALRSTELGTGPAYRVTHEWEACQGACLQSPACNVRQLLSSHSPSSAIWWDGCGYSNGGFSSPLPDSNASYLDADGSPVVCILDCPRNNQVL